MSQPEEEFESEEEIEPINLVEMSNSRLAAKLRADEKKRVMVVKRGKVFGFVGTWTQNCSGCTDYVDGQQVCGPMGCHECGYTGKRRISMWFPLPKSNQRKLYGA